MPRTETFLSQTVDILLSDSNIQAFIKTSNSNASGTDGFSACLIKKCETNLMKPLKISRNSSILTCIATQRMKDAIVIQILKPDSHRGDLSC